MNRTQPDRTGAVTHGAGLLVALGFVALVFHALPARGQSAPRELSFPPTLPDGREHVTDFATDFIKRSDGLDEEVAVARTVPTIDFLLYPGQTYPGKPWSVWGNGSAEQDRYFSAIGDHLAPAGNAFVFEYNATEKKFRTLFDLGAFLQLPAGHYTPGKIHSRVDLGSDGWLYFATHRGSTRVTSDTFHYRGDWVLRHHPATGKSEIVVHAPIPKHCIPTSVFDSARGIFYGATAPAESAEEQDACLFAFDVAAQRLLYSGPGGPARCIALAGSTGRVYFTPSRDEKSLLRFDATKEEAPEKIGEISGMRAATAETSTGMIYFVSSGQGGNAAVLSALNTRTEKTERLGHAAVGSENYIASLAADRSGRFIYYVPGAHGSADRDGSPVVQFDVATKRKKVIAFLHPFYATRYGFTLKGTYSTALDPAGEKLYITWNASRGGRAWDCCALTVIHIPRSEREIVSCSVE